MAAEAVPKRESRSWKVIAPMLSVRASCTQAIRSSLFSLARRPHGTPSGFLERGFGFLALEQPPDVGVMRQPQDEGEKRQPHTAIIVLPPMVLASTKEAGTARRAAVSAEADEMRVMKNVAKPRQR